MTDTAYVDCSCNHYILKERLERFRFQAESKEERSFPHQKKEKVFSYLIISSCLPDRTMGKNP